LITIRTGAGEDPGRTVLDQLFRIEKGGGADGRPPVVHLGTGEGEGTEGGTVLDQLLTGRPPRVRTA